MEERREYQMVLLDDSGSGTHCYCVHVCRRLVDFTLVRRPDPIILSHFSSRGSQTRTSPYILSRAGLGLMTFVKFGVTPVRAITERSDKLNDYEM